eukprot:TRINITY_DN6955_c0_g1_i1.p1 TRINITY_DN6955_c0_g1~~TRINITY_DN6955_c0_g1_i1.p1  ORF type:complete len:397 (+),score=71.28 TRINITY_DN6955_c0_g1_i1:99-1289(+)
MFHVVQTSCALARPSACMVAYILVIQLSLPLALKAANRDASGSLIGDGSASAFADVKWADASKTVRQNGGSRREAGSGVLSVSMDASGRLSRVDRDSRLLHRIVDGVVPNTSGTVNAEQALLNQIAIDRHRFGSHVEGGAPIRSLNNSGLDVLGAASVEDGEDVDELEDEFERRKLSGMVMDEEVEEPRPPAAHSLTQLGETLEDKDESNGSVALSLARRRRRRFAMSASYTCQFNGSGYDDIIDMTSGRLSGPFSMEFTSRLDSFRKWARMLDFGRGNRQESIVVSNTATPGELWFEAFDGNVGKGLLVPDAIETGVEATFLLTIGREGTMRVWKDGKILREMDEGLVPNRVFRGHFYVAKSSAEDVPLFYGLIKDLYVWTGESLKWGQRDGVTS